MCNKFLHINHENINKTSIMKISIVKYGFLLSFLKWLYSLLVKAFLLGGKIQISVSFYTFNFLLTAALTEKKWWSNGARSGEYTMWGKTSHHKSSQNCFCNIWPNVVIKQNDFLFTFVKKRPFSCKTSLIESVVVTKDFH